ncbi:MULTISPECIES: Stk1 family PASTA domain-containing Ser/Thr kinase [unclassified Luteococcus]|uniref:Stk1 family PASTA domain-containing Ser/Thr kinase n=1 Tax=unclassified Luteococcus TaxID=2639923 RepID=UPI00313ED2C6
MTATSVGDPLVGRVLDGRYEILAKLARGGMATVYRAQDRRLARTVAIKVMHDGLGDDAEFARKFDREARSAATLSNPHVVSVFDQGIDRGRPYIVMEFVTGCTLRHVITREAPLPPLRALDALEDIASALSSAHEAGLVHRDVKPENVLISDRGQIKVADFGLARAVTNQTATATQGLLIGTVSYLPPELVTTGRADSRSDVYSAGVVLFEMLTGKKPHTGETPIQVAYSHVHNDIPAPSTLLAGNDPRSMDSRRVIPPYLDALVVACTRRTPAERPSDGRELLRLVREARRALSHGILDDPALTRRMSESITRGEAAAQAPVVQPDAEATTVLARPATPASPLYPASPAHPASPATRVDLPPVQYAPAQHYGPPSPAAPLTSNPYSPISPHSQRWAPMPSGASAVDHDAERRRRVRRRRGGLALVLVVLLLTAALAFGSWWFTRTQYQAVPDLTNQQQAQAIALARTNGLGLQVEQAYSETVPRGRVIRTEPSAGDQVAKDSTVTAWISRGPERHLMPSVVGMNLEQARKAIEGAGLSVGTVGEDYSSDVPQGIIATVSQSPGTELKRGAKISLVVSKGQRPVTIRDYTGKTVETARRSLETAGFAVRVTEQLSDDVNQGKVISQNPNSGEGKLGQTITLTVSKGSEKVTVPGLNGRTESEAATALNQAGLQVKVVHVTPHAVREDKVQASYPTAGDKVKKGETVTIWIV